MCTSSVHAKHRLARRSEKLVIRRIPGNAHHSGFYPAEGEMQDLLVCLRGQKEVVLKHVRFVTKNLSMEIAAFKGKRNVKATFNGYNDHFQMPNGTQIYMGLLEEGVRVDFNVKVVRKPKAKVITGKLGMAEIEKAVKEALATNKPVAAKKKRAVKA